jgi:hypothetical protein
MEALWFLVADFLADTGGCRVEFGNRVVIIIIAERISSQI